jgi:hypothetical protein
MTLRTVTHGDFSPDQRRLLRTEQRLRTLGSETELLEAVVREETWRTANPDEPFTSFAEFVQAPAHRFGLGLTLSRFQTIVQLEHPHEAKLQEVRRRMTAMRAEIKRLLDDSDVPPTA